MKKILESLMEMERIALEELDSDINILTRQSRFELNTSLREAILKEKLILLYIMDVIDFTAFNEYSKLMKSLTEED